MATIRPIGPDDAELLCRHREAMYLTTGREAALIAEVMTGFRGWMVPRIHDGRCFGFVAEDHGVVAGSICLTTLDWPPHPNHPRDTKRGYVMNVYVEDSHRKTGLGRRLMLMAEHEFRQRGISFATLHATKMGRPLYEDMGWAATNEMSLRLLPQAG